MERRPRERDLLDAYVAPVAQLAGDRRTGRFLGEVIGGIVGSERLARRRIAAFSQVGGGPA